MWYKRKCLSSAKSDPNVWFNNEGRYGWFTVGIEWDSPRIIDEFQESEDLKDYVEDNCLIATSYLERIGFSKQHSYLVFTSDVGFNDATGNEAGGSANGRRIELPVSKIYEEDWAEILIHEWAHMYFYNLPKESQQYFQLQFDGVVKQAIEGEDPHEFISMVEDIMPDDIKSKFPKENIENIDIWKIYISNSLHKPEMARVRDALFMRGEIPSSYSAVNAEELWSECIVNYSKLNRNLKQAINAILGGA